MHYGHKEYKGRVGDTKKGAKKPKRQNTSMKGVKKGHQPKKGNKA